MTTRLMTAAATPVPSSAKEEGGGGGGGGRGRQQEKRKRKNVASRNWKEGRRRGDLRRLHAASSSSSNHFTRRREERGRRRDLRTVNSSARSQNLLRTLLQLYYKKTGEKKFVVTHCLAYKVRIEIKSFSFFLLFGPNILIKKHHDDTLLELYLP